MLGITPALKIAWRLDFESNPPSIYLKIYSRSSIRHLALLDETSALRAALVRLEDTGPRAGRKGPAEVTRLSRRHLHPLATALAFVTDRAIFPVTISITGTLTHAAVSWT